MLNNLNAFRRIRILNIKYNSSVNTAYGCERDVYKLLFNSTTALFSFKIWAINIIVGDGWDFNFCLSTLRLLIWTMSGSLWNSYRKNVNLRINIKTKESVSKGNQKAPTLDTWYPLILRVNALIITHLSSYSKSLA